MQMCSAHVLAVRVSHMDVSDTEVQVSDTSCDSQA